MSDITITKGDDVDLETTFEDENFDPINITWYTVFFTVKKKSDVDDDDATDSNAKIKKTVTTHTDPINGITVIALSNTDTKIDVWEYIADLQLKDPGWKISSTQSYSFDVLLEVTQRTS